MAKMSKIVKKFLKEYTDKDKEYDPLEHISDDEAKERLGGYKTREKERLKKTTLDEIGRIVERSSADVNWVIVDFLTAIFVIMIKDENYGPKLDYYLNMKIKNAIKISNINDELKKLIREMLVDYDGVRSLFLMGILKTSEAEELLANMGPVVDEIFDYLEQSKNKKENIEFDAVSQDIIGKMSANYTTKQGANRMARAIQKTIPEIAQIRGKSLPSPTDARRWMQIFCITAAYSGGLISKPIWERFYKLIMDYINSVGSLHYPKKVNDAIDNFANEMYKFVFKGEQVDANDLYKQFEDIYSKAYLEKI